MAIMSSKGINSALGFVNHTFPVPVIQLSWSNKAANRRYINVTATFPHKIIHGYRNLNFINIHMPTKNCKNRYLWWWDRSGTKATVC